MRPQSVKRFLARYLELLLTGVCLGVIFLIPVLYRPRTVAEYWRVVAGTAVIIGMLHGWVFWEIRRKFGRARIVEAARHTIHVQAENMMQIERLSPQDLDAAQVPNELRTWYYRGYAKAISDYEFTLDQIMEHVILSSDVGSFPPSSTAKPSGGAPVNRP
jgi:hypothetical protein